MASSCGSAATHSSHHAAVQKPAPDFDCDAVVGEEFVKVKLSDFKGKYLVVVFYPLDFTFVCPTEIIAFNDRAPEFAAINTSVVVASCDSTYSHLAWAKTPRAKGGLGGVQIPMIADFTKKMARDYGVLIEEAGVPLRGLFIIDGKGVLRQMTVNDLPVGRSVDETLRLVKAFQHTDEFGEVCPAGWTPGARTMVADPKKSLDYFGAASDSSAAAAAAPASADQDTKRSRQ